jgi:hypothetical protein
MPLGIQPIQLKRVQQCITKVGQTGRPGQKDEENQQRIATMVGKIATLKSGRLFPWPSERYNLFGVICQVEYVPLPPARWPELRLASYKKLVESITGGCFLAHCRSNKCSILFDRPVLLNLDQLGVEAAVAQISARIC